MNPELELLLQYIMLVCLFFIVLVIVYIGERAIRQESQRKQLSDTQYNTDMREQWLCEEHDKYLNQVTDSGMPIWMWDQSVPSINPNN
jgi:hypothetical protein